MKLGTVKKISKPQASSLKTPIKFIRLQSDQNKKKIQITSIRNERGDIAADPTKRIINIKIIINEFMNNLTQI